MTFINNKNFNERTADTQKEVGEDLTNMKLSHRRLELQTDYWLKLGKKASMSVTRTIIECGC